MTLQECYEAIGGDYSDVVGRLRTEDRIKRFLLKVLDDKNYALLISSIEEKNMAEAFRAAHSLKGISQNLSLTSLGNSASELSEVLRDRTEYGEDIEPALAKVKEDYERTVEGIRKLAES